MLGGNKVTLNIKKYGTFTEVRDSLRIKRVDVTVISLAVTQRDLGCRAFQET